MSYLRVIVKGSGLGEIFQFGWVINPQATITASACTAYVGSFIGLGVGSSGWLEGIRPYLSPSQAFTGVTVYGYAGRADEPATASGEGVIGSAQGVGLGVTQLPLQTCLVATLRTALSGASHRGRIYLPFTGRVPETNHQIAPGTADAIAAAVGKMLDMSRNASSSSGMSTEVPHVGVWSGKLGIFTEVDHVTVDTRLDVQRRRAESQHSVHTATSGITGGGP